MEITRDDYLFITVVWKSGFKHIVPCRGYKLKSEINFMKSIYYIDSFVWHKVTQKEYEERIWGSGSVVDTEKMTSTTTTPSARKTGQSEKVDGKKPSRIKPSAQPVTKTTSKRASSSVTTRKRTSGSQVKENIDGTRTRKSKTQQEAPAERKPRAKASETSKGVSKPKRQAAKRTTSTGKAKGNELRKPTVPDVRKPKKDVQGTNNPRTKAAPRTRNSKSKTQ
jgi:hypothetical protein